MRRVPRESMTGQSRAASRRDTESFVNGPAGGPDPPRLDVSGTDRSTALARYSDTDEEELDDDEEDTDHVNQHSASTETQIIRCYRCEAMSEYNPGNPLQVAITCNSMSAHSSPLSYQAVFLFFCFCFLSARGAEATLWRCFHPGTTRPRQRWRQRLPRTTAS
jgi:hypothetical protein